MNKKSVITVILVVGLIFIAVVGTVAILGSAFSTDTDTPQESDQFYDEPEYETDKFLTPPVTEAPTIPVSEWGFYNLDEMDNILIEITDYNFSADEPYVEFGKTETYSAYPDIYEFKNGNCYFYKISNINGHPDFVKDEFLGNYTINDNDTISVYVYGDGGYFMIKKRQTFSSNSSDVTPVVFVVSDNGASEKLFVPISLIDIDKGICEYSYKTETIKKQWSFNEEVAHCHYKLSLK